MSRKFKLTVLIGGICLLLILLASTFGCGSERTAEPNTPNTEEPSAPLKEITMRYAGYLAPDHLQETIPAWYAKELEERTNGRVKIELYHGEGLGELANFPDMLEGGVADIALLNVVQPKFTETTWEAQAWPFCSPDDMYSYLGAFNLALHKGLHDSWAEGYKLMWFQFTPARLMFLNKKVTTLEDFKGLKISGVSGVWVNLPELLGGTSVAIPGSDAYMALERGVVDGRVSMPDYVLSQSLYEVVDYCPWFPITGTGLFAVGMTMEKWNELPVDVQLIMEQLNQEAQWEWMDRYYISNEEYRHMLEETGIEVYDISDEEKERWTAALNPLLESLVKQYEEKGLPINELLETYKRFY